MSRLRHPPVPIVNPEVDAGVLMEQGILDVIKTPIDGKSTIYSEIMKTEVASLAVRAAFIKVTVDAHFSDFDPTDEITPAHSLIVHFAEPVKVEQRHRLLNVLGTSLMLHREIKATEGIDELAFFLGQQRGGGYGVSTVAGVRKGLAPLTEEMSRETARLLSISMDAGELEREYQESHASH